MTEDVTSKVIRWAMSRAVLAWRLRMIAQDGVRLGDEDQELACTVADLLDPDRKALWAEYLIATGASPAEADALWRELDGMAGIYGVNWQKVREALLNVPEPE